MNSEKKVLLASLVVLFAAIAAALLWSSVYRAQTLFPAGTLPASLAATTIEPKSPPIRPTDPTRGSQDKNAVTIVEFADYACVYCRVTDMEITRVIENETVPIRLVWRDLPITDDHPDSLMAAAAGRCAGDQNKFWDMHDAMIASQSLSIAALREMAQTVGLNTNTFNACLSSGKYISPIQDDVTLARSHGITGTPTLFIGKEVLTGTINANDIAAAVRRSAR